MSEKPWDGTERRRGGSEMALDHCDNHEQNTKDIASAKSSLAWMKWAIGLALPAILTIAIWVFSALLGNLVDLMKEMNSEIKDIKKAVEQIKVDQATDKANINSINAEIIDLKITLRSLPELQGRVLARRGD